MNKHYDSMEEAFEAMVDFVKENDEDSTDVPDLFFTARPKGRMSDYDLED